jgi:hypothetical protein
MFWVWSISSKCLTADAVRKAKGTTTETAETQNQLPETTNQSPKERRNHYHPWQQKPTETTQDSLPTNKTKKTTIETLKQAQINIFLIPMKSSFIQNFGSDFSKNIFQEPLFRFGSWSMS